MPLDYQFLSDSLPSGLFVLARGVIQEFVSRHESDDEIHLSFIVTGPEKIKVIIEVNAFFYLNFAYLDFVQP
jgi:hypothetical protein